MKHHLLLAALICIPSAHAKEYPLSFKSKCDVALTSLMGGILGGIAGAMGYSLIKDLPSRKYVPILGVEFQVPADKWCLSTIAGAATIGALIVAYYSYHDTYEKRQERYDKEFRENLEMHMADAQARWEELRNDVTLNLIEVLTEKDILNLEMWYLPEYRDSLYASYPLVSAAKFLAHKKNELKNLEYLNDKIIEVSEIYYAVTQMSHDQFMSYLIAVENALEVIEKSEAYKRQYALYQESLPKPRYQYVQPTPIIMPKPNYYYSPVVVQKPVIVPVAYPQPIQPKPASTVSPVLNGDVYGTIWSNY